MCLFDIELKSLLAAVHHAQPPIERVLNHPIDTFYSAAFCTFVHCRYLILIHPVGKGQKYGWPLQMSNDIQGSNQGGNFFQQSRPLLHQPAHPKTTHTNIDSSGTPDTVSYLAVIGSAELVAMGVGAGYLGNEYVKQKPENRVSTPIKHSSAPVPEVGVEPHAHLPSR
jgi:hypothetical protein